MSKIETTTTAPIIDADARQAALAETTMSTNIAPIIVAKEVGVE